VAASLAPAGQVWLVDVNTRAVALAQENARANRIGNARVAVGSGAGAIREGSIDVVVTNPPIRAGRDVVQAFVDDAWRVLRSGGRFYLVARTAQGARTVGRLIAQRFGGVREARVEAGYRVFEAIRPTASGSRRQDTQED
jgi:16S rRNA (guanine1207-N2)-methyltransferase